MDTSGSIKASGIRGTSFKPTPIEPALLATAKQFLENFQFDTRIRQLLYEDKLDQSVGKHKYYILGNEQKYEPGFLCIMKGHPVVFLSGRGQYGFALRMRVHSSLFQKEAVFLGTLDTIYATLRLEDVWVLNGTVTYMDPFSKRYDALQTFYTTMFVQDKHLSGFTVEVAKLAPLDSLRKIVDSKEFYSVDFVPEHGGRRRWHLPLAFTQQQKKIEMAPFNEKGPEKTLVEAAIPAQGLQDKGAKQDKTTKEAKQEVDTKHTHAVARKIVGMPDTYALQSKTNLDLGRAAVQTAGVSMLLRNAFGKEKKESVEVVIQWYEEFQRYKITGIDEV
jgi:hypothetical protein